MAVLRRIFAIVVTFLLIGIGDFAKAEETPWWEPLVCAKIDPKSPGGSPETARKVDLAELFTQLDAVANTNENYDYDFDEELPSPLPQNALTPNCHWIELEGYFRPIRYHNFRGQMLYDVADHYLAGAPIGMRSPHFWVENWSDQSVVSHALHNRRIRIRARVYDQCLAEMQYDRKRNKLGLRFGGACHYGENTGMILTDAEVIGVLSPEKVIAKRPDLSDALSRPAGIAKLSYPPTSQSEYEPLSSIEGLPPAASGVVRDWLRRVQSGPEAAIRSEKERETSISEEWRLTQIRELYAHPDGRYGYLNAHPNFTSLDPDKVKIKFLAAKPFGEWSDAPRNWHGFGCVALSPVVNWPVTELDAEYSIDSFVCTSISLWRDEAGDKWRD